MFAYQLKKGLFYEDWIIEAVERNNNIMFHAVKTVRIGSLKLKTESIKGLLPITTEPIKTGYVRIVGVVADQVQDIVLPSVIFKEIIKQFLVHRRVSG